MTTSKGVRAGGAFVELSADDSKLRKALAGVQRRMAAVGASLSRMGGGVASIGAKLAAVGGVLSAPLLGATKHFASAGDELHKMAARTGVSVESLSELGHAAQLSGSNLEALAMSFKGLNNKLLAAQAGGEAARAFEDLGLSVADLMKLDPEGRFKAVADAIARVPDASLQSAHAMRLFEETGVQLLPMLKAGAAGIEAMQAQARALGLTMSTADANAAATLTDRVTGLWDVLKRVAFTAGSALAPVLTLLAEKLTTGAVAVLQFAKDNKRLIRIAFSVAASVAAAGAALAAVGGALATGGFAMAGVVSGLAALGAAFAAIISPVGLAIGAIVAGGGALMWFTDAGSQLLTWLNDRFVSFADTAKKAFGGIADALKSGDLALAAKIAWAGLKLEWLRQTEGFRTSWIAFKTGFTQAVYQGAFGAATVFVTIWSKLREKWIEMTAVFKNVFAEATAGIATAWSKMQLQLQGELLVLWSLIDRSFDRIEALKMAMADANKDQQQIGDDRRATQSEATTKKNNDLANLKTETATLLKQIAAASSAKDAELETQANTALQGVADELAAAEAELASLLGQAKQQAAAAADGGPAAPVIKTLETAIASISSPLGNATSARGTFNAANILGLQGESGVQDRIAKATEATAKHTREIARNRNNGLAFS